MSLKDRYLKSAEELSSKRKELALERAQQQMSELWNNPQIQLSIYNQVSKGGMDVENIIDDKAVNVVLKTAIDASLDPKSSYIDTLRAKGFLPAEIRQITKRLYQMHCIKFDASIDVETLLYEDMLNSVSAYMYAHQELYNSLSPQDLRTDS